MFQFHFVDPDQKWGPDFCDMPLETSSQKFSPQKGPPEPYVILSHHMALQPKTKLKQTTEMIGVTINFY